MTTESEVLRQDRRGRVRVPRERREALLEEFARGGVSAAQFARLAGLHYQTFIGWVHRQRRHRSAVATGASAGANGAVAGGGVVRLLEALVDGEPGAGQLPTGAHGLVVELPGGSRMVVQSPVQMQMAAELVALVAQRLRVRC